MCIRDSPGLTVRIDDLFHFEFNGSMVRRILFIGIPTGLENGMFQAGKLLVLNLSLIHIWSLRSGLWTPMAQNCC